MNGIEGSRREAILKLAETFLWRGEVKEHQFHIVLNVLEALGWLDDGTVSRIHDDMEQLYPSESEKEDRKAKLVRPQT